MVSERGKIDASFLADLIRTDLDNIASDEAGDQDIDCYVDFSEWHSAGLTVRVDEEEYLISIERQPPNKKQV